MSFLTPLYAIAALAIALPVLLHLIRKQPKGNQEFSSLMFLDPSPPRLTRRSRIDHWLLLILRAMALLFLAAAFTRPYWNVAESTEAEPASRRRMILVDTSASMRRQGVWENSLKKVQEIVDKASPEDRIAIYTFDDSLHPLVALDDALPKAANNQQANIVASLKSASLSWKASDLGLALVTAADMLHGSEGEIEDSVKDSGELIVVSDFQNGSSTSRLENYQWPTGCRVRLETVLPAKPGNAFAQILIDDAAVQGELAEEESDRSIRVRVTNSSDSTSEKFQLKWHDANRMPVGDSVDLQVARGESLVVKIPSPQENAVSLQLEGDAVEYDNTLYVARDKPVALTLACIDDEKRPSSQSLGYFLEKLPLGDASHQVRFQWTAPGSSPFLAKPSESPLIVASHLMTDTDVQSLHDFVHGGGKLLWCLDGSAEDPVAASAMESRLAKLTGDSKGKIGEAPKSDYAMLERIDFTHPIFSGLTDSKFNDFTKIRFWSHRRLDVSEDPSWQTLASFDDHFPALLYRPLGSGGLWILAAGWQPEQSQLALSSKFVPIMAGIFRQAIPARTSAKTASVGDRFSWTEGQKLIDPKGQQVDGELNEESKAWSAELATPGTYRCVADQVTYPVAVNLAASESDVSPMDSERLERLGVQMSLQTSLAQQQATKRQLRATELESQQGWWRWFLIAVVSAVVIETSIGAIRPWRRSVATPSA